MGEHYAISFSVDPERKEEITEAAENGSWKSRSEYLRVMVQAGESRIAELDPRTSSTEDSERGFEENIIRALDSDWQERDEVLETVLDELRGDIATTLHEKAENDPNSPVEFNPAKGYRLEE